MATLRERFDVKWQLDAETGCWVWTAGCGRRGYGKIETNDHGKRRTEAAHRVAYRLFVGPIPDGMAVLHHCDRPGCVNPEHLFLGTQADNMADKVAKGRQARGEGHGAAKLTRRRAAEILGLRESGRSKSEISRAFGISRRQITRIWNGISWAELGA